MSDDEEKGRRRPGSRRPQGRARVARRQKGPVPPDLRLAGGTPRPNAPPRTSWNTFTKGFLVAAGGLAAVVTFLFAAWLVLDTVANYSGFADCVEEKFLNDSLPSGSPPTMVWDLAARLLGCVNSVGTLLVGLAGAALIVAMGYIPLALARLRLEDFREWWKRKVHLSE